MVPDGSTIGEGAMLESHEIAGPAETASEQGPLTGCGCDSGCGCDPPLDLVHLARQCQGDCELENELLGLFLLQLRDLAAQLSGVLSASLDSKAKIAHKLRGSALAVGARRVASAARRIEECVSAARNHVPTNAEDLAAVTQAIAALDPAVSEVVAEIERNRG
jgi:HPt (histidine-containing phosphotransfer) domain-containing protein